MKKEEEATEGKHFGHASMANLMKDKRTMI
jgi:hypothetical protein